MTQEEKELLLKDLCARLPYYTELYSNVADGNWAILTPVVISNLMSATDKLVIKPYLRSMSSMTEEEKRHVSKMMCLKTYGNGVVYDIPYDVYTPYYVMEDCLNYLRSIHVDYSGLIEKGLAIKAPEGMYNNQK